MSVPRGKTGNYGDIVDLSKTRRYPFPWKLMKLLDDVEVKNDQHIVSWLQGGRAFQIHDRQTFMNDLVPIYFSMKSFKSFQRQLYLYGFDRISTCGPAKGAFFHPMFLKGQFQLTFEIHREPQVPKTHAADVAAAQRKRTKPEPSTDPIEYYATAPSFSSAMQQFQQPQNQSGVYQPPRHQQPMVSRTITPSLNNPVAPPPTVPSNYESSLTQLLLSAVIGQLLSTISTLQGRDEQSSAQGSCSYDANAHNSSLFQQVLTNALPHLQNSQQEQSTERLNLPSVSYPQRPQGQPQQHWAESSRRFPATPASQNVEHGNPNSNLHPTSIFPILHPSHNEQQEQAAPGSTATIRSLQQQQQQQHHYHDDVDYGTVSAAPSQTSSSVLPPIAGYSGASEHSVAVSHSPIRPNFSAQDTAPVEANSTQALSTAMIIALLQQRQQGLSTIMVESSSSMASPSPAIDFSSSPPAAAEQQQRHPSSSSSPLSSQPPTSSSSSSEDWLSDLEKYLPPPSG